MGYSIENGGHYAHLHHGLYPGRFSETHNYGYKMEKDGLSDWYDPAEVLVEWMELSAPIIPELKPLDPELDRAAAQLAKGKPGKAYSMAQKLLGGDAEEGAQADAQYMIEALEAAPKGLIQRAAGLRDRGFPGAALELLKDGAKVLKGIPGAEELKDTATSWGKDDAVKQALKAEAELMAAKGKVAKMKKKDREKGRALFQSILDRYRDTPVKQRILDAMERALDE
jgi:hypothetical protein